jgi:pimeloyl-ACP methyl ester carboxylesterase
MMPVEQYASTLEHLATRGYFVIATRSQGEVFPDAGQYARDLSDCLTYLEVQNGDAGSWLFRQIATERFGMCGHSLGGGASILATAADPRVRVLVTLAAAETFPSAIARMPEIHVPVRLIAGSVDAVVRLELHGLPMYENANAPRQLAVIDGGSHCGFMDQSTIGCDISTVPRAEQLAITSRMMIEFLDLYLYEQRSNWEAVWGAGYSEDAALDRNATRSDAGL